MTVFKWPLLWNGTFHFLYFQKNWKTIFIEFECKEAVSATDNITKRKKNWKKKSYQNYVHRLTIPRSLLIVDVSREKQIHSNCERNHVKNQQMLITT
jgi:hypothetical protein